MTEETTWCCGTDLSAAPTDSPASSWQVYWQHLFSICARDLLNVACPLFPIALLKLRRQLQYGTIYEPLRKPGRPCLGVEGDEKYTTREADF
jgi:hypothetical protein